MSSRRVASVNLDDCKGGDNSFTAQTSMWLSEIESPDVALRLACFPTGISSEKNASASTPVSPVIVCQDLSAREEAQELTVNRATRGFAEDNQDDEVGSAMTEEFNSSSIMSVSENERQPKQEGVRFEDWASAKPMDKNLPGLEKMDQNGIMSLLSGSGRELDGIEDLRRYSLSTEQAGKLPSSHYKGVVPQPNGRWGAQIYEKHQRVWLGTFNSEEDAAKAYDRAALKFRGRDAITNFSLDRDGDPEVRFMREHKKEEIVDMLRKHTYDEEFGHHSKKIMTTAARLAAMNGAKTSGAEESGLINLVCQENQAAVHGNANGVASMRGLAREHLFDKAVTPSDVGKLNRLVIPKQHAEKYFPLDANYREKGLVLNFEDKMGRVWRFRYSYWSSSQSYVLTKGWSRFVKDKKLEAGDIVSFHRGSSKLHQLYISWRRRPLCQSWQLGSGSQSYQSYPVNGSPSMNPFKSGTQAAVVYNAQWMPIFFPVTQFNSNSSSLLRKVDRTLWPDSPGVLPFCFSAPANKQIERGSFPDVNPDRLPTMDLYHNNPKSLSSGNGSTGIKPLDRFINPTLPSVGEKPPEHKPTLSLDPTTKKGVRLFGVNLAEHQRLLPQHHVQLNLFP